MNLVVCRCLGLRLALCISMLALQFVFYPEALLFGQSPAMLNFTSTTWRVSDGLPENRVHALTESLDGALWIGTTGGLAKTAGVKIRSHDIGLLPSMENVGIPSLLITRDGTLWIGTEGQGLIHLTQRNPKRISENRLGNAYVRSIFEDSQSNLWIGTDRGLFEINEKSDEAVLLNDSRTRAPVVSITEDAKHTLWWGGDNLFSREQTGTIQEYVLPNSEKGNRINALLATRDGTIWIATSRGLLQMDKGKLKPVLSVPSPVNTLLQTSDGTLWAGTSGDGLWFLKRAMWAHEDTGYLLPSSTILDLLQDHFGQLWIGTNAGLVRLTPTPVTLLPLPGIGNASYATISADKDGSLWVAADAVYKIRNNKSQEVPSTLRKMHIREIYQSRNGAIWFGTEGNGLFRLLGSEMHHFSAPESLTGSSIRAIFEDREGRMWVGTNNGITEISQHGRIARLTEDSGLPYGSIRTIIQDRRGVLWFGTDRGVAAWRDGILLRSDLISKLRSEKVWSVYEDRRGALWFGTRDHGLFRFLNGQLRHYGRSKGLPTNSIFAIQQDHQGRFWIFGPNTLFSLSEKEMDSDSSEALLNPSIRLLPSHGVQLFGGQQPEVYVAPDDTLWFPTNRGLASINPNAKTQKPLAPTIALREISVDGRVSWLTGTANLPSNIVRVSLPLTVNDLRSQDAIRIRYRLEGLETKWNDARPEDLATYTNLRAGHYVLHVEAKNLASPEAISEADYFLNKAPSLHERIWFYPLCALLLLLCIWGMYKAKLRQVRLRFNAVVQERARLAREMHDTVIQNCIGISSLLTALDSNAREESEEFQDLMTYAMDLTSETIDHARQAVWGMRHAPENDSDLVEVLQALAEQTVRDHPQMTVAVEPSPAIRLHSSVVHELLMVAREGVYNAIQHSGTNKITLIVEAAGDAVSMEINDEGCGFDPTRGPGSEEGHYGIMGMRERIKRLGGSLQIIPQPSGGTSLRVIVPRASTLKPAEIL